MTSTPSQPGPSVTTRRIQIGVAGVIVLAALLALSIFGMQTRAPLTALSGSQREGKPAPAFALKTFDGEEVSLAQMQGQPIVMNFWASWCAPCRVETPHLIESYEKYKDQGVVFVGVNIQDTRKDAEAFLKDFQMPAGYFIINDSTGDVTVDYGVAGLPVTFFIDRDGYIAKRWVGALDGAVLDANIAAIATQS